MTNNQNDTLLLNVKRLGINGEGIAYYKKRAVFIPRALPKEKVLVKITKKHRNYWEAKLLKVQKASKERVQPKCPIYEKCGGCQLQHLAYSAQCKYKEDIIKQALAKFKPQDYENYVFKPSIDACDPWFYRNKLQFQARMIKQQPALGLYEINSHHLIPIKQCDIQKPLTQAIANTVQQLLSKYNASLYNERKHTGWLKTLMVREAVATNECQVVFITTTRDFPSKQLIIQELVHKHPEIISIMQNINKDKTSTIMGNKTVNIYGKDSIEEQLNDVIFDLSAQAFFQLNPAQTQKLYAAVKEAMHLNQNDIIIDAYCGVGTIGLSMAKNVKQILGMDIIKEGITNAKLNAKRLGVNNTHYEVGDAVKLIPQWLTKYHPTGIVVDPPRTGLTAKLCQTLVKHPLPKMVYVSCNPSTLAQDLVILSQKYNVEFIQSIDMFPQTARVEVIVSLTAKDYQPK